MEEKRTNEIIGGRYQILEKIGHGANGYVYLVMDLKLHKKWALKECREVSETESEVLRRLDYPAFPRIVDIVEHQEHICLIMDYIEGKTLRELMGQRSIKEKEVREWGIVIARAMEYLHMQTPPIYYLDCKPENIMVTAQKEIKIIDVGSACVNTGSMESRRISGTRFYAPREQKEQTKQHLIDEKTDIYSLGMTLYVMLAGKEREYRSRNGRLLVHRANPGASLQISCIIEKCTQVQPQKRYQSMKEVEHALVHMSGNSFRERCRAFLARTAEISEDICIGIGILYSGGQYERSKVLVWLLIMLLLLTAFFLSCKRKKSMVYEMKKDIFRGMGKRILSLSMVLCLMAGANTYAAGEKAQQLSVILYDEQGRKILIREGTFWKVSENIVLEIPIEEISSEGQMITVSMTRGEEEKKQYQFMCIAGKE